MAACGDPLLAAVRPVNLFASAKEHIYIHNIVLSNTIIGITSKNHGISATVGAGDIFPCSGGCLALNIQRLSVKKIGLILLCKRELLLECDSRYLFWEASRATVTGGRRTWAEASLSRYYRNIPILKLKCRVRQEIFPDFKGLYLGNG